MKFIKSIVLILILFTSITYAEDETQLNFEWIDREDGLSNLSVSSMFQDKHGFIWFGTQGGLNRYDGTNFVTFRSDPFDENTLYNNLIQTMTYDETSHEIWIGTYQGLTRFIIDEERFVNYTIESHGLSNEVVTSVIRQNNKIWIGTLGGLDCLDLETDKVINYAIPGDVVRDIEVTESGILYIGTYDGLYYFDNGFKAYPIDLPSSYVMVVREFEENILTLGLWDGGVVEIDLINKSFSKFTFEDNRIYTLEKDHEDNLWVGSWGGGLFIMNQKDHNEHYPGISESNDISHQVVYSLLSDDSDIMWVGTNGGGISKWNPRKTNYVILEHDPENDNTISRGKVNVIYEFQDKLYIGLYDQGLNIYDLKTHDFKRFNTDNSTLHINSINDIVYYNDKLLLATGEGLTYFDGETFEIWPLLPEDLIAYALETDGETLWIGTYNQGVYVYDGQLKQFTSENSKLSNDLIYDIHLDVRGQVWVGTNHGLNIITKDDDILVYVKGDENHYLPSNKIQSIYEDSNNHLWFGTAGGGVLHYDTEIQVFESFTEQEGLSSNEVLGMSEDDDQHLWIATNDGISRLDKNSSEIIIYTPIDGIGGWEFSRGYTAANNKIYFGGTHGITIIDKHIDSFDNTPPRVYITNINTFDNMLSSALKIYNDETIKVLPSESYLVFDVVTVEFDNPEKASVVYKLVGIDEEWIYLGKNRRIAYSNMPAGDYTLQVQVFSSNNKVSEIEEVYIEVLTPWYLKSYMVLVYVILLLTLINLIIRMREAKAVKHKNDELSDLNDQLGAMNKALESLAITDPLTSLYNRRYFKQTLTEEIELARRSHTFVSVLMIDIDDFKVLNDRYGHLEGDQLLIEFSDKLKNALTRKTDFASRYGGDEFAVVLYDTDREGTLFMANHILETCSGLIKTNKNEVLMNISIGVICKIPNEYDSLDTLMKEADDGLYRAKSLGKNQMCY